jgi:NTP pyrophosphatase (non-canonical NTP hydrolase)
MMNERQTEVMRIAQEESAEIIQAISKVLRFGKDNCHPDSTQTNAEHLAEEVGDMLCMIELLIETKVVSESQVQKAARLKRNKLRKWSKIFSEKDENCA